MFARRLYCEAPMYLNMYLARFLGVTLDTYQDTSGYVYMDISHILEMWAPSLPRPDLSTSSPDRLWFTLSWAVGRFGRAISLTYIL
jgi:hypothetical protein